MNFETIINFEKSILSSIIFEPTLLLKIKNLEAKHFSLNEHKNIYKVIMLLDKNGMPIDEEVIKHNLKDKFNENIMVSILSANPISNLNFYIEKIIDSFTKREIESFAHSIKTELSEEKSIFEIFTNIDSKLKNLKSNHIINNLFDLTPAKEINATFPYFFLENILPIQKNEITIFSAKGGSAKSYVVAYVAMLLANKENLKIFGWFSEDNKGVTKTRLNNLTSVYPELQLDNIYLEGKEVTPFQITDKKLNVKKEFYLMKEQLKSFDVIILDPLIAFFGADENNNSDARFFMNLLNEWCQQENKTIIVIHHHSKGENGTARGAGAFIDACRIHYTVNEDNQKDERYRIIKLEKRNHYSGSKEFRIQLFDTKIFNENIKEDKIPQETEVMYAGLRGIVIEENEENEEDKKTIKKLAGKGFVFE